MLILSHSSFGPYFFSISVIIPNYTSKCGAVLWYFRTPVKIFKREIEKLVFNYDLWLYHWAILMFMTNLPSLVGVWGLIPGYKFSGFEQKDYALIKAYMKILFIIPDRAKEKDVQWFLKVVNVPQIIYNFLRIYLIVMNLFLRW